SRQVGSRSRLETRKSLPARRGWNNSRAGPESTANKEYRRRHPEASLQYRTIATHLRTDPAAIEKIAREQLKLVKLGEVAFSRKTQNRKRHDRRTNKSNELHSEFRYPKAPHFVS